MRAAQGVLWRDVSLRERVEICTQFIAAFRSMKESVALDITRQMGKPLVQARREVDTMLDRAATMVRLAPGALQDDVLPPKEGFRRFIYAHKQDVLRRAIERHFPPGVRVNYPDGGMSVWVELPAFVDAAELLVKARERRVIFAPARYFYFQNPKHNALRLCFTALPDDKIEKGVVILGDLLKAEVRRARKERPRSAAGASVALV